MQLINAFLTISFLGAVTSNIVEDNARGIGGWGGSCTCPDGQVYQVGDLGNWCGSLACYGGVAGTCHKNHGQWSNRRVVCAIPSGNIVVNGAKGVGGWGGTCTCPDGHVYQVGDSKDWCGALACYGGTSGHCNRHDGPWSNRLVVCGKVSGNNVEHRAHGVGGWGGSCTCPDGQVYQVGDWGNWCGSLACEGGTAGQCHRNNGPWSNKSVKCGGNVVEENAEGVGGWGGSCTCPDGQVYQVGDYYDWCGSLACVGGTAGACTRQYGSWSNRKVTCAAWA